MPATDLVVKWPGGQSTNHSRAPVLPKKKAPVPCPDPRAGEFICCADEHLYAHVLLCAQCGGMLGPACPAAAQIRRKKRAAACWACGVPHADPCRPHAPPYKASSAHATTLVHISVPLERQAQGSPAIAALAKTALSRTSSDCNACQRSCTLSKFRCKTRYQASLQPSGLNSPIIPRIDTQTHTCTHLHARLRAHMHAKIPHWFPKQNALLQPQRITMTHGIQL